MASRVPLRTLLSSANQTLISLPFSGSTHRLCFRPVFSIIAANTPSVLPCGYKCPFFLINWSSFNGVVEVFNSAC